MIPVILITLGSLGFIGAFVIVTYILSQKNADRGLLRNIKKWRQTLLPLSIIVDDSIEDFEVRDGVNYAMEFWNKTIGVEFFKLYEPDSPTTRQVVSVTATTNKIPALANAVLLYDSDGRIKSAAVFVDMSDIVRMGQTLIRRMMAHEFGHLLGLDHDLFSESIMYGKAVDEEAEITQNDIALLREIYGGDNGLG